MSSIRKDFVDNSTKIIFANAIVPEEYTTSASVNNNWQSSAVPFTYGINAVSPDKKVLLYSGSRQIYEEMLNSFTKNWALKDPNVIKSGIRDFIEPEALAKQIAEGLTRTQVKAVCKAKLPSAYGQNLGKVTQDTLNYFNSHAINIKVQLAVTSIYCDAFYIKYKTTINNQEVIVIVGLDYQGIEYYDANNVMGMMNGMMSGGILGNLFKQNKSQTTSNANAGKFGHSKEAGKKVDSILWGYDRVYALIAPLELDEQATNDYLAFVQSLMINPSVTQRFNQLVEQRHQQEYQNSLRMAMLADQKSMQAMQAQRNLTQQLQRNSEEISAGIMDSWNKRSASLDRMSTNYSEAIRGVNSYTTPSGSTVEFDNVADHVYMDQYGDRWGVSGNGLDQSDLNNLNWTELHKK